MSFIVLLFSFAMPSSVSAVVCTGCPPAEPQTTAIMVQAAHKLGETSIKAWLDGSFSLHQRYLVTEFWDGLVKPAFQAFTKQMTAVSAQKSMIIGSFFDAKQQLETQRLYQELQVEAHKDYQPSKDFCYFGTNVRSLASSERISDVNKLALNSHQMKRHLGHASVGGDASQDRASRWKQFQTTYCDIKDNDWAVKNVADSGLKKACLNTGAQDKAFVNSDIDFGGTIGSPRTIDVAFYEDKEASTPTEEKVIALGNNLFGHDVLTRFQDNFLADVNNQNLYMALRSVAAKRNVAENSYNALVGLKSSGVKNAKNAAGDTETRQFLAAIMKELGVPPDEIYKTIGDNPSYYAQLEILAKKIYQTPNFFAGLYDKPANVERKSVALKAVELMVDRAIYESQLRQEMAMSVLLSSKLEPELKLVSTKLGGANR